MSHFVGYARLADRRWRERYGLAFEEFEIGWRFRHRPGLTLSDQDGKEECLDTLNQQMLHFDAAFCAHTEWKRLLMDSTLTARVVLGMTWKTFGQRTELLGFDEIALPKPVFGGDTLTAESEILALGPVPSDRTVGRLKARTTGFNQRGEAVCAMVYDQHIARRGFDPRERHQY